MSQQRTGQSFQERSKGKDVRTSNIVAAKVSASNDGRRDPISILTIPVLIRC